MCGIVGIVSTESIADRDCLRASLDAMRHRGPDGRGEWWDENGRVGYGHLRLAIIDLSSAALQPMSDASSELCIVYNGEIYNYRELRDELGRRGAVFHTQSDTEVILAAYREWGVDCLARLGGMFAFALYDLRKRRVLLARDRAGEKPLFYSLNSGSLVFASELKGLPAISRSERRLDRASLDIFLAEGYVPGDRCILEGVHKLPAGHAMTFELDGGATKVWRYWGLPPATAVAASADALVEELERLFAAAVRRQLVADVPVGVLLSGGVDSSLVTAMVVRASSKIKTFTVRFPGHDRYDESRHARMIANHFGTEHVELDAAHATVDMLPLLARQFDEPIADSSMVPTYMLSRMVRQHCTVALGGDGGDELFGGYSHYNRLLWLERRSRFVPRSVRRAVACAANFTPLGYKGRNWLRAVRADFRRDVPLIASYFDAPARRRLLCDPGPQLGTAERSYSTRVPAGVDLLDRATRMDFQNYLAEDILVKVDRASMLNSLEVRAPFLDCDMIEFAFGKVPSTLKATTSARKILLKRLGAKLLPPGFDLQRKQGFSIPIGAWLREGQWLDFFRSVLLDPSQSLFNRRYLEELFAGQSRGFSNGERLFSLTLFELWRRHYEIKS